MKATDSRLPLLRRCICGIKGAVNSKRVNTLFSSNPDVEYDMVCSDIENFKSLNDRYGKQNCEYHRDNGQLPIGSYHAP